MQGSVVPASAGDIAQNLKFLRGLDHTAFGDFGPQSVFHHPLIDIYELGGKITFDYRLYDSQSQGRYLLWLLSQSPNSVL